MLLVGLVVLGQEPPTFRSPRINFAWGSLRPLCILACASMPLLRAMTTPASRPAWERRYTDHRIQRLAGETLGGAVAIFLLGLAIAAAWFTLDRIYTGVSRVDPALLCAESSMLLALPLSTMSGLLHLVPAAGYRIITWAVLLLLGVGALGTPIGIPLQAVLALRHSADGLEPRLLAAVGLVALAGAALRAALAPKPTHDHAHRHSR